MLERPPRILVVDDDPTFRDVLEMRLERWGYQVKVADRARKARSLVQSWRPDLVLSDVVMPEVSGMQLLNQLREDDPGRPVILLTAHATVEMAVDAMKVGAIDFLTKPLNYPNLQAVIKEALARTHRRSDHEESTSDRSTTSSSRAPQEGELGPFMGTSRAMIEVYELIRSVAESDAAVLITGESGTGKELAAQTIHELSGRAGGPFVAVNAAAIPRELMESEIFGHEKGAFTGATDARPGCFEMADDGTLFLDEIGEMPRELQPKLLRVLDRARIRRVGGKREVTFNVRTLAATNRDPRQAVEEGILREDLFFRLNVLHVHLPPLRERAGDVTLLSRRFAEEFSAKHGGEVRSFEDQALDCMEAYDWPGNVRELRNLVERAVVLAREGIIRPSHLPPYVRVPDAPSTGGEFRFPEGVSAAEVEKALYLQTLDDTGNNKAEAARRLGVSVRTVRNKLNAWKIDR